MSEPRRSQATLLVDIAEELYVFGYVDTGRTNQHGERPEPYTWAAPRFDPQQRRPLAEIRADLAMEYQLRHGGVPNATALGDAMTVLEGKARKGERVAEDDAGVGDLLGLFGAKTSVATQLVKLAHERYRLGVTTTGEAYAVPTDGPNIARVLRGGRRSLRAELARAYYRKHNAAANASALADALLVLEGEAQDLPPTEVALRVGRCPKGRLVLDLGRDDGKVAVVGPDGWEVSAASPVLFWRTNATLPLPVPTRGEDLGGLRRLLNIQRADWPIVLAYLVAALFPEIPHPVLLLRGEHGTAKSTAARLLTSLVDPCASQLRTAPRDVEDWCVAAAGSWMTCLDNISNIQEWLSDAICRASTGDGLLRRQLYTDSDVSVLAFKRVVAITSVEPGRLAGDLADRLVSVELQRIPEDSRAGEQDIAMEWEQVKAEVLGALLDLTAEVLRVLPAVRRTGLPRMADFARVLIATDKVMGTDGYGRYVEQAGRTAEQVAEGDSVSIAIREHITGPWEGTATELLKLTSPEDKPRDWPTTPQGMGARLTRAAPSLRAIGWTVEPPDRTRNPKLRKWTIVPPTAYLQDGAEEDPAGMEPAEPTEHTLFDLGKPGSDPQADTGSLPAERSMPDTEDAAGVWNDVRPGQRADSGAGSMRSVSTGDFSALPTCTRCGEPLDPVHADEGTHPSCDPGEDRP